jgi:hypothetical protein
MAAKEGREEARARLGWEADPSAGRPGRGVQGRSRGDYERVIGADGFRKSGNLAPGDLARGDSRPARPPGFGLDKLK